MQYQNRFNNKNIQNVEIKELGSVYSRFATFKEGKTILEDVYHRVTKYKTFDKRTITEFGATYKPRYGSINKL